MMKGQTANLITGLRIACGVALLFLKPLSPPFLILYIAAGVTDMIDGAAARKTGTVSELGSKLDTAADLVLTAVCLIKLIPVLDVPPWLLIWIAVIALIKTINVISGYVMHREFAAVHTVMNKLTGLLLFALPLTLPFIDLRYSGALVSAAATLAAVQEGHLIRTTETQDDRPIMA